MFKAETANDSCGVLSRLLKSQTGNVLPILAAAIIPLAGLIGGGADVARIYMAKTRLQQACDAGSLVGRKIMGSGVWTSTGANSANTQAQNFFKANFENGYYGTKDVSATFGSSAGGVVKGTATATLPMTVMQIFGQNEKTLTVTCDAALNLSNTDVMFVLDTTGSMGQCASGNSCGSNTKIVGLRSAVKAFYAALAPTITADSQLRYGFVPYAANVNVGSILYNGDPSHSWMKTNAVYQSRKWEVNTALIANAWGTAVTTYGNEVIASTNSSNYSTITTAYGSYPAVNTSANTSNKCSALAIPPDGPTSNYAAAQYSNTTTKVNAATGVKTTTYLITRFYQKYQYKYKWGSSKCSLQRRTYQWDTEANGTDTQQPTGWTPGATSTVWHYMPLEFDTTTYLASIVPTNPVASTMTGQGGTSSAPTNVAVTSRWDGCIHERQTVSASNFAPIPDGALDLDLNTVPTNETEKWAPAWGNITYARNGSPEELINVTSSQHSSLSGSACPRPASKMQRYDDTNNSSASAGKAEFDAYVNALSAGGSTYHDIGMIWGGRLISPIGLFEDENKLTDSDQPITRHLIFMTDGELAPTTSVYGMYGVENIERRITGTAGTGTQYARHEARFLAACQEVRDMNVTIWLIGFGTAISDAMYTCAGDDPSDPTAAKHTFSAGSNEELTQNFQNIAANIAELRLEN